MAGINLNIGDELVERIAERAAALIAQRQKKAAGDGWLRGADKIAPTSARPGRASTASFLHDESPSTTTARR